MYSGEEEEICIEFDKSLIDVMMDKFGTSVAIEGVDDKHCRLKARVQISPVFFGWCAILGEKLRIISPETVIKEYCSNLTRSLEQYCVGGKFHT